MFHYLHFSKFETLAYRILVCDTVWSKVCHEWVWPYAWRICQLTIWRWEGLRQHDEENKSEAFSEYSAAHRTHWQLSPAGRRVQTRTTPAWKPYSFSFSRILKETERIFHPSPSLFIEKGLAKCKFSFMRKQMKFSEKLSLLQKFKLIFKRDITTLTPIFSAIVQIQMIWNNFKLNNSNPQILCISGSNIISIKHENTKQRKHLVIIG